MARFPSAHRLNADAEVPSFGPFSFTPEPPHARLVGLYMLAALLSAFGALLVIAWALS